MLRSLQMPPGPLKGGIRSLLTLSVRRGEEPDRVGREPHLFEDECKSGGTRMAKWDSSGLLLRLLGYSCAGGH
jgi:hypothetical protein